MTQLAGYRAMRSVQGPQPEPGTLTLTSPPLHRSVTDTAIQHLLQQEISTKAAVPHPTPNTLYFVYLPPGVKVIQGGAASCQAFCS